MLDDRVTVLLASQRRGMERDLGEKGRWTIMQEKGACGGTESSSDVVFRVYSYDFTVSNALSIFLTDNRKVIDHVYERNTG